MGLKHWSKNKNTARVVSQHHCYLKVGYLDECKVKCMISSYFHILHPHTLTVEPSQTAFHFHICPKVGLLLKKKKKKKGPDTISRMTQHKHHVKSMCFGRFKKKKKSRAV